MRLTRSVQAWQAQLMVWSRRTACKAAHRQRSLSAPVCAPKPHATRAPRTKADQQGAAEQAGYYLTRSVLLQVARRVACASGKGVWIVREQVARDVPGIVAEHPEWVKAMLSAEGASLGCGRVLCQDNCHVVPCILHTAPSHDWRLGSAAL
jgi:hypothetical protein